MNDESGGGASRSTDPASGTSAATDVSLREFLSAAINESRRECRDNIDGLRNHVDDLQRHNEEKRKEEMSDITRRFDSVNEFRNALSDLSKLMATRDNLARVEEKFEAGAHAREARITALERRIDLREGQDVGSRLTKAGLYVAITAAVAVIGLLIVLANVLTSQ